MSYNVANLPRVSVPSSNSANRTKEQTGKLGNKEVKTINAKEVLKGNKGVKTGGAGKTALAVILLCVLFAPIAIPIFILYALAVSNDSHRVHYHHRYHHGHHSHSYHHHHPRW